MDYFSRDTIHIHVVQVSIPCRPHAYPVNLSRLSRVPILNSAICFPK